MVNRRTKGPVELTGPFHFSPCENSRPATGRAMVGAILRGNFLD